MTDAAAAPRTWTVLGILEWTTDFFGKQDVDSPRLDAELLLSEVLGMQRIMLYANYDRPLSDAERDAFRALVKRRGRGEPVQYILGEREFWSLPFEVRPGVLIPRPDTECLVEEAVAEAKRMRAQGHTSFAVADVGTGSGAIAVALATELPEARVWAGDVMPTPLEVAPRNVEKNGVADRVTVLEADGLMPLWEAAGRVPLQLVCSNPPYIREGDLAGLMREVRDHEPREALVSGADGLDVLRFLVRDVARPGVLDPDGAVLLEIGDAEQARIVSGGLKRVGFEDVRVRDDYAGRARVVIGRWRVPPPPPPREPDDAGAKEPAETDAPA